MIITYNIRYDNITIISRSIASSSFNIPQNIPLNVPLKISLNVPLNIPLNVPLNVPQNVPLNITFKSVAVDQVQHFFLFNL